LVQADQVNGETVKGKSAASCPEDSIKIIKGILNAKRLEEIAKWRERAQRYGGPEVVLKCLITNTINQMAKNYQEFKSKLLNDLNYEEKDKQIGKNS